MSDAFAGESAAAATPRFESIQLELLSPDPMQPRKTFDKVSLQSLSDSIRANGLIQPIVTRPKADGGFEIVAGERRWRAAKMAGIEQIPAIVRDDLVGKDVIVLQVLENLQREDLPLAETSAGVARLVALEGVAKACELLGKSEPWVSRHAGVTKLPDDVQRLVSEGLVESADIAHDLAELQQVDKQRAARLMNEFVVCAEQESWRQPPTRAQIRDNLKTAKDSVEYKERQRQEKAKLKEKAKADPKLAKQLADQKRKEESRKGIRERIEEATKACRSFADGLQKQLRTLAGIKGSSESWRSPLAVQPPYLHGEKEPPKAAQSANYRVSSHGSFEVVQKAAKLLAPEGAKLRASIEKDVTIVEAAKLAEVLGSRVQFSFEVERPGSKLEALVLHPMQAGKGEGSRDPEANPIHRFLAERTRKGLPAQRVKASDLHAVYAVWCKTNKLSPESLNSNEWGNAVKAAGIEKIRSNGLHYTGIKLVDQAVAA